MKEFQWPYKSIDKEDLRKSVIFAGDILKKYGAEYVDVVEAWGVWLLDDGTKGYEKREKCVWKRENEYIRIDSVYFQQKPYLVLEFSEEKDGPYEDADPFPYDLPYEEMECEIRYALGIDVV